MTTPTTPRQSIAAYAADLARLSADADAIERSLDLHRSAPATWELRIRQKGGRWMVELNGQALSAHAAELLTKEITDLLRDAARGMDEAAEAAAMSAFRPPVLALDIPEHEEDEWPAGLPIGAHAVGGDEDDDTTPPQDEDLQPPAPAPAPLRFERPTQEDDGDAA